MKNIKWTAGALLFSCIVALTGCVQEKDPAQYTITFQQDGCADVVRYVTEGKGLSESSIPQPKAVTGYTVEWETVDFKSITGNIVVKAIATPNEYTVTYQLSETLGESFKTETSLTQTITYDSQYTLAEVQRYGYSFVGWTGKYGTLAQTGVWKTADDVTLTATWANNYYTVTFAHANGTTENVMVEKGDVLSADKIPACKTVEGYNTYWENVDYTKINENTTVNAVKDPISYRVSYQLAADESIQGDAFESLEYGAPYTLKTPTRAGYTFRYWKTENGAAVSLTGESWSIANALTLTAEWTANENLITFVQADGTTAERTVLTGEVLTDIPECKQVPGYDVHWEITDFSSVTGAMTVNAIKVPQTYTITYSVPEDAAVDGKKDSVTYKTDYHLKTATRYGYTLTGWRTEDGTTIPLTGTWEIVGSQTLTAVWAENFYTITFIHVDGTQETRQVENGDILTNIPATQTVKGHTVTWSITDFSTVSSNVTVNPIVVPNEYTVTLSLSTGESIVGEKAMSIKYGANYTLPIPKNSDSSLKFVSWVVSGTGKEIPLKGVWNYDSSYTLVATWEEDEEGDWTDNY